MENRQFNTFERALIYFGEYILPPFIDKISRWRMFSWILDDLNEITMDEEDIID